MVIIVKLVCTFVSSDVTDTNFLRFFISDCDRDLKCRTFALDAEVSYEKSLKQIDAYMYMYIYI